MNIIVTGGAGFIGSNFVFHMLKKYPDYRIICLDKLTYAGNLSTLAPVMDNPNFRFVKADICDREAVDKLFKEEHPDIVVNFAAESHVDRSIEDPGIFLQTNIIGTSVLMDACRKYGIQRYHQVSTDEVYGDLPLDRPDLFFTEETPIHTSSPYSSSKAAADLLVLAYHRTYGLPVTISRCSNNYGPYHFPEKLIPLMIANALEDKPLPVYGEGLNVRDWLYVEDHCKSHLPDYIPTRMFDFFVEMGTSVWGHFCISKADACKAVSQTDIPILIIHGDRDTQAPLSMAYRLYDSCSSEKQLYVVHGANHAENYRKDPEGYENVIAQFVEEHSGALKKEY